MRTPISRDLARASNYFSYVVAGFFLSGQITNDPSALCFTHNSSSTLVLLLTTAYIYLALISPALADDSLNVWPSVSSSSPTSPQISCSYRRHCQELCCAGAAATRYCRTRAPTVLVNMRCHYEMALLSFTITRGKKKKKLQSRQLNRKKTIRCMVSKGLALLPKCCRSCFSSSYSVMGRVANYPALLIKRLCLFIGIKFYRSSS